MRIGHLFIALGLALATANSAAAQSAPGWRDVDPENVWVIDTNKGRIIAELTPAIAPKHVERIKILTRQGLYNGRTFFRVIDDFMAQTGDPEDTGTGGSSLPDLEPEFAFRRGRDAPFTPVASNRPGTGIVGALPVMSQPDAQMIFTADGKVPAQALFCPGTLGMARSAEPNSANSQFFLMRAEAEPLNGKYTVFGRVLQGLDVVRAIKTGEPVDPPQDTMTKVQILADMPVGQRPFVRARITTGPEFATYAQTQSAAKGASFNICDLDIAVSVQ